MPGNAWTLACAVVVGCPIGACAVAAAASPSTASAPAAPAVAPSERWSRLADTVFQHATSEQGFTPGSVTAIAQDGDGFLWVGTHNGLLRWDGYRVRRYQTDPGAPGRLRDNFVQALHADALGRLWIGTGTAGLASYDRETDSFISYPVGVRGLSDVSVKSIADDGAGGVWMGTSGGLDRLKADGTFAHIRHDASDPASLPDNQLGGLLRDRQGGLWIGTASGLVRHDPDTGALMRVPLGEGKQPQADSMLQDSSGKVWIGTGTAGAFVYDPFVGIATQLRDSSGESRLETEDVDQIAEARPGEVWLGTIGGGIVVVDTATLRMHRMRHDPQIPATLANDTIRAIYRDRSGLMWTGTDAGLGRTNPAQRAFLTVFGADGRQRGLADADVISVLPMPDGRVWLGLGGNGIDVVDPSGTSAGRVAEIRPDPLKPETALPHEHVLALAGTDAVYVGSLRGLYRADPSAHGVVRVDLPGFNAGDSADALFHANESLWVGNWSGVLWRLQEKPGAAVMELVARSTAGFTDKRVLAIARAPNDGWWVGTGNGLTRLDAKLDVVERIVPDSADPYALVCGSVTSLLTDRDGRLWVGTLVGISVLEQRDARGRARFRSLGAADGLSNIAMLLKDTAGNIWASSGTGLAAIDPHSFSIERFDRSDGLAISNYRAGSGAVTKQGELLFGGLGGLTVVRPQLRAAWTYQPPLVVTEARVGGRTVAVGQLNDGSAKQPLTVAADANSLSVEFSALDLSAPEQNRYAYRLDGYDTQWIETDATRRFASYANLPPGHYMLRLRGSNRTGAWSGRSLSVPIRVLPTFFQTLGFRVLLALAGIALVCLFVRVRTALVQRHKRELEKSVAVRTLKLQEPTRSLEAK